MPACTEPPVHRLNCCAVITDKLGSYTRPLKALALNADHRTYEVLNNGIEGSHRPTCKPDAFQLGTDDALEMIA